MTHNLLGPEPLQLPEDPATGPLAAGESPESQARAYPASCLAWAVLAERSLDVGDDVAAYAYARTGYHRGLDLLRRNGWKGAGRIPYSHPGNHGFLRALSALGQAAAQFEEAEEVERIRGFLLDADPEIPARFLP